MTAMAKDQKDYSETEKIGTMLIALAEGVAVAARKTDTSSSTIYHWFEESGGIGNIRAFTEAATQDALLTANRAVYEAVAKRVGDLSDTDLMTTFRKMIEVEAAGRGESGPAAVAQAGATAIGELHVHVDGEEIVVAREPVPTLTESAAAH